MISRCNEMRDIRRDTQFKRDVKRARKRGKDIEKLKSHYFCILYVRKNYHPKTRIIPLKQQF